MNELCLNWCESAKDLKFRLLNKSPFYEILHPFSIMTIKCRCIIFQMVLGDCYNGYKRRVPGIITQQQFVNEVWGCCINKCYTLLSTCVDGSAFAHELDELFKNKQFGYDIDKRGIQSNLKALHDGLQLSFPNRPPPVPPDNKWAVDVSEKVESFRFSKNCCEIANDLLKLKSYLQYEYEYELLQDIAKEVCVHTCLHIE